MLNDIDMDYVVAAALEEGMEVPDHLHQCEIPAGDYLVYEIEISQIGEAWGNAIAWMERNGYTIPHGTSFEFYDERMDDSVPVMDLYIPIAKKKISKEM